MVFLKECFEKVNFETKISRRQKSHENIPRMQRVKDGGLLLNLPTVESAPCAKYYKNIKCPCAKSNYLPCLMLSWSERLNRYVSACFISFKSVTLSNVWIFSNFFLKIIIIIYC